MSSTYENGVLTIDLCGRITTDNAASEDEMIREELSSHPDVKELYFDATDLDYISSAGLRLLLTLQKERGTKIHVINVSDEVMDIFETTGFTGLMYIRKPFKEISVEGCPVIGIGTFGTVYRIDEERIVKVYNKIRNESILSNIERDRNLSSELFQRGIPTAIPYDVVRVGEYYGVIYELLKAQSLLEFMNTDSPYMQEVFTDTALLAKKLHTTKADDLNIPDGNAFLKKWYRGTAQIFDEKEQAAIDRFLMTLPEGDTILHGDFHPGNIMVCDKGPGVKPEVMLIDLGDIKKGHPCSDIIYMYPLTRLTVGPFKDEAFVSVIGQLESRNTDKGMQVSKMEQSYDVMSERKGQLWDAFLTTYFGAKTEEEMTKTEEILCEFCMVKFFTLFAKKKLQDRSLLELVEKPYFENIELLNSLFDLSWQE